MSVDDKKLDIEALKERYRIERDRRLQGEGERQYHDIEDGFSHLLADPYTKPVARAPLTDSVDVLIVGGGLGGLLAGARLREAGVKRIRIVEAGGDVGGAWYWNRYPGAACDVESYIYLPLLEETGYMSVERYSKADEIREHCKRIARHFNLYNDAIFSTHVTDLHWDHDAVQWAVYTDRGDVMRTQFVVMTTGPLNRPKLPEIPGAQTFKRHYFHTSRWDYDYTGGSPTTPMDKLADKVVGVIGTGASAVQCVPHLAADAKQLFVFQRTPVSVDARDNVATDPEWVASLKPGWQKERVESFTAQLSGQLEVPDLVGDGWTVLARAVREKLAHTPNPSPSKLFEEADFEKMADMRARIDAIVEDPSTANALKPWYSLYCKRPCFHDEYLATFNRPNVSLVDTEGRGVERITETSVVAGGKEYPVDCLIFATGFEVSTDYSKRAGIQVYGENNQSLSEKWADGMVSLHGFHTHGFPNFFIVSQSQAGMSANFMHMLTVQAEHIGYIVKTCIERGIASVDVTEQAEQSWLESVLSYAERRRRLLELCTPGYYNNEGDISSVVERSAAFGGGPGAYIKILQDWRAEGELKGLDLKYGRVGVAP